MNWRKFKADTNFIYLSEWKNLDQDNSNIKSNNDRYREKKYK